MIILAFDEILWCIHLKIRCARDREGKAEEILEKIAMGKLNKFYKENTLLNQEFINDSKVTIREYLQKADKDLTVTAFKRLQLGA